MSNGNGNKERIVVGLGESHVADGSDAVLVCVGLGSCIAVCVHDPVSKVGGIAHMVLPHWREAHGVEPGPKFVDCGIPLLVGQMEALGAARSRLKVKIAGGAQMVSTVSANRIFEIGERNVASAKATLKRMGLQLSGTDVGGSCGRTVQFHPDSGKILITTVGEGSREL